MPLRLAVPLLFLLSAAPLVAQSSPPTIKLSGYLQARETWQENVGLTASINRARLGATGTVAPQCDADRPSSPCRPCGKSCADRPRPPHKG